MFRDMNKQALNRYNTKAHCANKPKLHVINLLEKNTELMKKYSRYREL